MRRSDQMARQQSDCREGRVWAPAKGPRICLQSHHHQIVPSCGWCSRRHAKPRSRCFRWSRTHYRGSRLIRCCSLISKIFNYASLQINLVLIFDDCWSFKSVLLGNRWWIGWTNNHIQLHYRFESSGRNTRAKSKSWWPKCKARMLPKKSCLAYFKLKFYIEGPTGIWQEKFF